MTPLCERGGHRSAPVSLLLVFFSSGLLSPAFGQADPATVGQYSATQATPWRAIHAHLLPTGKVMFWDSYEHADKAQLWDPATGSFTAAAAADFNIFCTGFSFLPDGRLLVTGGHVADFVGLPNASLYNSHTNTWTKLPPMSAGRWYPTNTTLPNGDALVVSGQIDNTMGMNPLPQVFQARTSTWRNLTSANLTLPFYPYMYVAPNGKVFAAGPDPTSRYLDTAGTGAWSEVAKYNYGARTWGSSAMYGNGKVMVSGGSGCAPYDYGCSGTPTNTIEVIDLNAATPAWSYATPMAHARKQHNTTILPDGKILVTGGSSGSEGPAATPTPVYPTELWDPDGDVVTGKGKWTTLASLPVPRAYHSVALLLPDGRVFSAGGNDHASYEVFSPPYLFKGARPRISSVNAPLTLGQTAFVGSLDATSITKVSMVALGTVTHAFNAGQRINFVPFTQATGGINVILPTSGNLMPPGQYMLFLLNSTGVPSVAKIVQVDAAVVGAPAAPTNLAAARSGNKQITVSWKDNSANEDGFEVHRSTDGVNYALMGTVGANVTTFKNSGLKSGVVYSYRVRAYNAGGGTSDFSNVNSASL